MSVRKRQWYTSKQIRDRAVELAAEAGHPEGAWTEYRDRARAELSAVLRGARDPKNKAARRELERFPPQDAWVIDYVDQDGERHIETFSKKKDAEARHDKVRVDVRHGIHTAPSKSETVAEAAQHWLNRVEAEGRERGTLAQYRQHVRIHIAPRIGRYKLAHLMPTKIESFRDDLLADLSRPMARKVLTSLKSLLKVAKHAHVAADVSVGRSKRAERKLEVGRDIPTPVEIKRLVTAAKDDARMHALLLTAALCGLRASELRGLRWTDIDLRAGELTVRQRADRYNTIGPPKSASSTRIIPLSPEVVAALKLWKLACPKGELDLVFPPRTGAIMYHRSMLDSLAPMMVAAGVTDKHGNPKYGLHAFRHFFASWCINRRAAGGRELPAKVVQELLGHSSIVMTLDRYGHLFPRSDDRAELAAASGALLA
jgi:integrase